MSNKKFQNKNMYKYIYLYLLSVMNKLVYLHTLYTKQIIY